MSFRDYLRIFPKNIDFFALFEKQADILHEAVIIIRTLEKGADIKKTAIAMKKVEHKADDCTHEIIKNLNMTFITPIDREDITSLASHIDDVVDELEHAINRIDIYHIKPIPKVIYEYLKLIDQQLKVVSDCICNMRQSKKMAQVLKYCEEANNLENKMDELHRKTLAELFQKEKNAIKIMKIREIYDTLESVTDRGEDVANNVEAILVKNA